MFGLLLYSEKIRIESSKPIEHVCNYSLVLDWQKTHEQFHQPFRNSSNANFKRRPGCKLSSIVGYVTVSIFRWPECLPVSSLTLRDHPSGASFDTRVLGLIFMKLGLRKRSLWRQQRWEYNIKTNLRRCVIVSGGQLSGWIISHLLKCI
jgi:hypothetical protein